VVQGPDGLLDLGPIWQAHRLPFLDPQEVRQAKDGQQIHHHKIILQRPCHMPVDSIDQNQHCPSGTEPRRLVHSFPHFSHRLITLNINMAPIEPVYQHADVDVAGGYLQWMHNVVADLISCIINLSNVKGLTIVQ
jgi:hypothetical protein